MKDLLIIGHRGTRIFYDENTIEAFEIAFRSGAQVVEFDIRSSNDGKIVVMHDETINRTTNGSGLVNKMSYSELKSFHTINRNCEIPLIDDVFNRFSSLEIFMIEIKDVKIKDLLLDTISKHNLQRRMILSGRNHKLLQNLKRKIPNCLLCYNITKGENLTLDQFLHEDYISLPEPQIDMFSLKSNYVNDYFIEKCHKFNIKALAWDFIKYTNPIKKIKALINMGIDGVLFDNYKNIIKIKKCLENI